MYTPPLFEQKDTQAMYDLIAAYPFAMLISNGEIQPMITHIPLQLHYRKNGEAVLQGHLAKANPHAAALQNGTQVAAVFAGPHAYISSSWYGHINVPTWNYAAVHVHGSIRLYDREETIQALDSLTKHYEQGREKAFDISHMPEKMLNAHLAELTAFEIGISNMHASWKLSQNRNETDFRNIIAELEKQRDQNADGVAEMMKDIRK